MSNYPKKAFGHSAANGSEALAQIYEKTFDVALMDMSMPGRSGIELITQVKAEIGDIGAQYA